MRTNTVSYPYIHSCSGRGASVVVTSPTWRRIYRKEHQVIRNFGLGRSGLMMGMGLSLKLHESLMFQAVVQSPVCQVSPVFAEICPFRLYKNFTRLAAGQAAGNGSTFRSIYTDYKNGNRQHHPAVTRRPSPATQAPRSKASSPIGPRTTSDFGRQLRRLEKQLFLLVLISRRGKIRPTSERQPDGSHL